MLSSMLKKLFTIILLLNVTSSIDVDQFFTDLKNSIYQNNKNNILINFPPFFKFNFTSTFKDHQEVNIDGYYGEYGKLLHTFKYNYKEFSRNSWLINFQQSVNSKSSSSKILLPLIYHSKEHYNPGFRK